MFGAILGDIIGSPYEFDRGDKTKDFPLFGRDSYFTDDTIMTVAVADAFLKYGEEDSRYLHRGTALPYRHSFIRDVRRWFGFVLCRWHPLDNWFL